MVRWHRILFIHFSFMIFRNILFIHRHIHICIYMNVCVYMYILLEIYITLLDTNTLCMVTDNFRSVCYR